MQGPLTDDQMVAFARSLASGSAEEGVVLDAAQVSSLISYLKLLLQWNSVYNLTAIRDPAEMLVAHILDSLSIVPWVDRSGARRILDVGSGAGLPGIPLAVARPSLRVDLVDAVQKKVAFQTQAKATLSLSNLYPIHARVEALTIDNSIGGYDLIVSRAFSSLTDFVAMAGHLVNTGGVLLAMKGQHPDEELAMLDRDWTVASIDDVTVPGLKAARCLVALHRNPDRADIATAPSGIELAHARDH